MSGLSEILKRPTEMSDVSGASPVIRTANSSRPSAPNVANARSNPFFNIELPWQPAAVGLSLRRKCTPSQSWRFEPSEQAIAQCGDKLLREETDLTESIRPK